MKKLIQYCGLTTAIFCLLAAPVQAELNVGDDAPDVTFKGSNGKTIKLADYEGKQHVVLAWFPKAFTGG